MDNKNGKVSTVKSFKSACATDQYQAPQIPSYVNIGRNMGCLSSLNGVAQIQTHKKSVAWEIWCYVATPWSISKRFCLIFFFFLSKALMDKNTSVSSLLFIKTREKHLLTRSILTSFPVSMTHSLFFFLEAEENQLPHLKNNLPYRLHLG